MKPNHDTLVLIYLKKVRKSYASAVKFVMSYTFKRSLSL